MDARSNAWVCGSSLGVIAGSNPAGGMDVCLLLSVVCCHVEISAWGWSFVQRSPTECVVSKWVWSRSFDNEETLAHQRLLYHGETNIFAGENFLKISEIYVIITSLLALQPWVSLGLLNNPPPLLSVLHRLHPLLYLHCRQVCYHIVHPSNIVLTFQFAIVKSDFHTPFVKVCFSSFRGWLLGFETNYFYDVGLEPHAQIPTWRTRVSLFVWVIAHDLSAMGGPTSSIRYLQHSSRGSYDHASLSITSK